MSKSTAIEEIEPQQKSSIKHQINRLRSFGDDGVEIANNETYHITDLELFNSLGEVRETKSYTILYPNKTTRGHAHEKEDESYHFIKGTGLLLKQTEDESKIYEIQPETFDVIEAKTWHQVINTSKNEDIEFETSYPGKSDRPIIQRPYINAEVKKKK